MLLLNHIRSHVIHLFLTFSLSSLIIFLLINLWLCNYSSSNIFPIFTFLFPYCSIPQPYNSSIPGHGKTDHNFLTRSDPTPIFLTQSKNELTRDPTHVFCGSTWPNSQPKPFFKKKIVKKIIKLRQY